MILLNTYYLNFPGNRPKYKKTLEVYMDSVPFSAAQRPRDLKHLQNIAHYTGTTLRLLEDEISIEGYSLPLIELTKRVIKYGMEEKRSSVEVGSVVSSTEGPDISSTSKPSVSYSAPVVELGEVSSTTEGPMTADPEPSSDLEGAGPDVVTLEDAMHNLRSDTG